MLRRRGGFAVERPSGPALWAHDEGDLLFAFESDLAVSLQRLRRDLFFLHAGAVATHEGAALLVGDSGAGKSTLTWSLVRGGLAYLSDELAPVSLDEMRVHAYPRAISLKEPPPAPFELPSGTLQTGGSYRVAVGEPGAEPVAPPLPVGAIFFLEATARDPDGPAARPLGVAEAAARLLANALNPASHPGGGLDAALAIAGSARCLALRRAPLESACQGVRAALRTDPPDVDGAPRGTA